MTGFRMSTSSGSSAAMLNRKRAGSLVGQTPQRIEWGERMRNPVKITDAMIAKIKRLLAQGVTARDIATRFGIHVGSVRRATR